VLLDCVIYCAFYSILFSGAVFFRSRCMNSVFGQWTECHLSLLLVALELLLNPSIDFAGRHALLAHDVCNDWRWLMTEFTVHDVMLQSSVDTV